MRRWPKLCVVLTITWLGGACHEPSDARPSRVLAPRILAISAEPAEAKAGTEASYRVLAVDAAGELSDEPAHWSYCKTRKASGDPRIVAPSCAQTAQAPFDDEGTTVFGRVPADACERFGPSALTGDRPNDADATGGFYQPLRVEVDGVTAVGLHRIACPLPNVPRELVFELRERYVLNENPVIEALDAAAVVDRGESLRLALAVSDDSAERFVLYDANSVTIVTARESLRAAWYATGGELEHERSNVALTDNRLRAQNTWVAPRQRGRVQLWVVLRDSRGGVAFTGVAIDVR